MRWLYPFETGHCTETKVTTVIGPRKAANDTDFPSRSWTLKSVTLEPSLNSCADKMPAETNSEIARILFMTFPYLFNLRLTVAVFCVLYILSVFVPLVAPS